MIKSVCAALAASMVFLSSAGLSLAENTSGKCVLQQSKGWDEKVVKVEVGKVIKGTCKFYISDFFDKKIINANIQLQNTGDKAMHCQYYVAFFDEAGKLIGCSGQGTFSKEGLAAGESTQLGSCLIPLPSGEHEKAVSYQITFYEGEKEIGKE